MALFDALREMVGAAVLSAAPACDLIVPAEVGQARADFAPWLEARDEVAPLNTIVEALGREIWVGAETRSLSKQILEHHIRTIAAALIEHPPLREHLVRAIDPARIGQEAEQESIARLIAADVFGRVHAAGIVTAAGLNDDAALFLLDRAYAHLFDDPNVFFAFGQALADFIMERTHVTSSVARDAGTARLAAYGLSAPLAARIEAAGGLAKLTEIRERFGLTEPALRRTLVLLDSQGVRPEDLLHRLEDMARWVSDVRAQLTKPSNVDADIRRLKERAAAALAEGNFEAAMDCLKHVRHALREGRRRSEERLQEELANLSAQMVEEAVATGRLAELALARKDYDLAAELFSEAALSLPSTDRNGICKFNFQRAEALYRKAEASMDANVLGEAMKAYANVARLVADGSNQPALGHASLGVANTLLLAGERESDTSRLKDAAAAYRKAISIITPKDDRRSWSLAQLRLGRTLCLIGERDKAPAPLQEAAQAFRDALKELPRDHYPVDHTTAQLGLGTTLLALEEAGGGTPLLAEAADAFSAALRGLSREANGAQWAKAQMNLGIALLGLGEQQNAVAKLENAVKAFRAALEFYQRATDAQNWALTHMNLGNAYAALGDQDMRTTAPLEDAITAYNAALEEFQRETQPLKWAITQMNLGTALVRLGERRDKRRHWLAAAGALVPALEVFETHGAATYAEVTRQNLRRFQESWDALIDPQKSVEAPRPRLPKAS